jgi:nitrogen regulatory protein PII
MKMIAAYIQPFMTEKVTDALRSSKVHGVTMVACQGFGRMADDKNAPRYLEEAAAFGFAPKSKLEIVCLDSAVEEIVGIIPQHAHTGHHGDGKVFISDISGAVDIRTGAKSEAAI